MGLLLEKYFSEEAQVHEVNVSASSEARFDTCSALGLAVFSHKEIIDEVLA